MIRFIEVSKSCVLIILESRPSKTLCYLLLSSFLLCANAQSQSVQSFIKAGTTLYSAKSKIEISEISQTSDYQIMERDGSWVLVRFNQPTVPVWVSQNYLRFEETNRATVTASSLNMRLRPSLDAPVLASIDSGYTSDVLAFKDGFAQIKGPGNLVVAINDSGFGDKPLTALNEKPLRAPNQSALRAPDEKPLKAPDENALRAPDANSSDNTVSKTVDSREHILAPGDAISVVIFGEPDLSLSNARIPENGQISFPLIGSMAVTGSTTNNIERKLRAKYAQGYVKNPKLSVTIFSYRPIFIRGGVRSTGAFPYSEGLTVAKALALAGGTKNSAKRNGISILRNGQIVKSDLALDSLDLILSGDVITVTEDEGVSDEPTAFIYLHGEVNVAGEYSYRKNLTVEKAIVLAGGFSLRGSRRKVSVTRYTEGQEKPEKFNRVKMFFPVKPGDIINVGARLF